MSISRRDWLKELFGKRSTHMAGAVVLGGLSQVLGGKPAPSPDEAGRAWAKQWRSGLEHPPGEADATGADAAAQEAVGEPQSTVRGESTEGVTGAGDISPDCSTEFEGRTNSANHAS